MQTVLASPLDSAQTIPGRVVITGGASGLGRAIAQAVTAAGGSAITLDLNSAASANDHRIVDCGDRRAIEQSIADIARDYGGIDAVIANAGIDACGDFSDVTAEDWERVITVNLLGTAAIARAALPHLERSANGRFVSVASTLGLRVLGAASAYSASKFGVVGFTRGLALDVAGRIGVTLLIPGGMDTAFFDGRDPQFKPASDALEKNQLNDPREVAHAVVFAITRPKGVEVRELIITPSRETSWP